MSTTKELLQTLNALRTASGRTELSAWKSSREKLESAIAELQPTDRTDPSMPMGENGNSLIDPLDEVVSRRRRLATDLTSDGTPSPAVQKSPRGAIGALVIELLATDMPYEAIVERVRETYPDARTTARSIASVAMDLRRDGVDVPSRRRPAAEKPAKASKPSQEG